MSGMLKTPTEVTTFRSRFPIFRDKVHLASNSMGAVSDVVLEAAEACMRERLERGTTWPLAMQRHDALRETFARLIGARIGEVAICCSATQAMGAIASSLSWERRPKVLFDAYSFPSMAYLWRAQAMRGAEAVMVPAGNDARLRPEAFDPYLDSSVQIVCVSSLCYKNGHRLDIRALSERVHAVGAILAVDDYQSFGTRAMDMEALGIDILVTGTAKYMLGAPGLGLLYVREALLDRLHPTLTGWFGQQDMLEFQIDQHDEAGDARRFQTGTPAMGAMYESLAAARLLEEIGLEHIGAWVTQLTGHAIDRLTAAGHTVITPRDDAARGPQVTLAVSDAPTAVAALAERGVICSTRDGKIRTAWHYYNTADDITVLEEALSGVA
ncbi:aminotransferase class V-fold PLP-dependent enzyme [Pseudooceanicola sp. CBS1P-1]|uniref:Aminotransferase class V-fold PLP-dependent enzyme n=1 Tax=Pseudooceanicola albus TaxID=2692189 RepID=A0A6L7GAU4_9RHOB|nr:MULTISPECIES: aminotransferase class V-fold PLP-dependent enzyme [Pseudooceanicola]MBT9386591.1 aminotransferase class V-fold PLP-dependent enzyme [Pseudooceanicola endophyticus]MXN20707.1 aminotransferase class V-fold PLP-dependent enzyme [Pseudooceanicola albus]